MRSPQKMALGGLYSLLLPSNLQKRCILTPWQGRPTLKPTASTVSTRSGSGRPPPGVLLMNGHLMTTTTTTTTPHDHIYKLMFSEVSQPIFFKLGHIVDMTWAGVIGGLKFVLATVGAFFDRFASNLAETCIWHGRVVSC